MSFYSKLIFATLLMASAHIYPSGGQGALKTLHSPKASQHKTSCAKPQAAALSLLFTKQYSSSEGKALLSKKWDRINKKLTPLKVFPSRIIQHNTVPNRLRFRQAEYLVPSDWNNKSDQLVTAEFLDDGDPEGTIHITNERSNERSTDYNFRESTAKVTALSWDHDGDRLAVGDSAGIVRLWKWHALSLKSGIELNDLEGSSIDLFSWAPNNTKLAAIAGYYTIQIWNIQTGSLGPTLNDRNKIFHTLTWAPSSDKLATIDEDSIVRIWNTQTGRQVPLKENAKNIAAIAWSPDGAQLAMARRNAIDLWNMERLSRERTLDMYYDGQTIEAIAWSPDKTKLAVGLRKGVAYIWNLQTGMQEIELYNASFTLNSIRWLAHGETLTLDQYNRRSFFDITDCHDFLAMNLTDEQIMLVVLLDEYDEQTIPSLIDEYGRQARELKIAKEKPILTHIADFAKSRGTSATEIARTCEKQNEIEWLAFKLKLQPSEIRHALEMIKEFKTPAKIAQLAQSKFPAIRGITAAEIVRILETFQPTIKENLLEKYKIDFDEYANTLAASNKLIQTKQNIIPPLAQGEVADILEEYIVEKRPTMPPKAPQPEDPLILISKQLQREDVRKNANRRLSAAIKAGDFKAFREDADRPAGERFLNPVSIVSADPNEEMRTPLMNAIYYHNDALNQQGNQIFTTLLEYSGDIIVDGRKETRHSNLAAVDFKGHTPLMLAIGLRRFYFAFRIAQQLLKINVELAKTARDDNEFQKLKAHAVRKAFVHKNGTGESAYTMAAAKAEQYKNNTDYQKLMKILETQGK